MNGNIVYDVVRELIGDIFPIGQSHIDSKRFDNLKEMCTLVDKLIFDIDQVIQMKDDERYSIQKAGNFADKFFDELGIKE